MAISKEQWSGIQSTLASTLGCVKFRLPSGEAVTVNKAFISENKTGLVVWIDDVRSEAWGWPPHDEFRPITKQIWRRKTHQPGAKQVRKISAMKGGKTWLKRKENAYLFEVHEYWVGYFTTAASLVRQFRKIEGLELIVEGVSDDE
ncbi:hypothetical protein [Citrobacter braakii]|uniref:hypothetical protein n=1 Tax=Citrobacter braakii TaxID=57706 RepID=UPI0040390EC6